MLQFTKFISKVIFSVLFLFVGGELKAGVAIPIPQWHMTHMTQDRQGMIWFATWNGLCRYDGYDFAVFKNKPGDGINVQSDRVRSVVLGKDGNLYCRIEDELLRFNLTTYKYEKTNIKSLKEVMVGGYGKTKDEESYASQALDKDIRQTFTDQQGNVWLLTRYGATKVVKSEPPMQYLDYVSRNTIRCIFHDTQKHQIWIATKQDGIVAIIDENANLVGYLGKNGRINSRPENVFPVYCIARKDQTTLWVGTKPDGLYRLREQNGGAYQIQKISTSVLSDGDVYDVKFDNKGRLWVATHGKGIFLCANPDAESPTFTSLASLTKGMNEETYKVRRLYPMPDGKRLLAASVAGMMVIDGIESNDVSKFRLTIHHREADRASSISNSATMNLIIPEKKGDRLYVSTESGGVNMLLTDDLSSDRFDFEHLGYEKGICDDDVCSVTKFGDEILIITLDDIAFYNAKTGVSRNYNAQFWCSPLRFSDATPILLTDGRWIFGLEEGAIIVPDKAFLQKSYVPKIAISSVKIEGKSIRYDVNHLDTLVLQSDERNVNIKFAALDFRTEGGIAYQTRFKSGEWSAPSYDHTITLYDLTPGEYTLQIRSTNASGLMTENTRSLTVIVKPYWYETVWAKIFYILLIIISISSVTYLIIYIRNINAKRHETLEAYLALLEMNSAKEADKSVDDASRNLTVNIPVSKSDQEDEAFMTRLLAYIEANIGNNDAGVDDMAEAVAMSRSSLTRKMKQLLGVTPSDFLREARMKHACQLLKDSSSRSTSEVAYACGFSDPKYFAKCFKASMGMSPREYREK